VRSVEAKGLSVMVDPSRTFVRVWATADQWKKVLGQPLKLPKATPSLPFAVYDFPSVPKFRNLTYVGGGATVYDAAIDSDGGGGYGASVKDAVAINRPRRRQLGPVPVDQRDVPGVRGVGDVGSPRSAVPVWCWTRATSAPARLCGTTGPTASSLAAAVASARCSRGRGTKTT
jgi:hypothetical protein